MGLNTCLNAMGDRYAPRVRIPTKADQKTVQALQTEFTTELNSLNDRAKLLESQATALESQQFSTTTKIQGQVVFSFQGGGVR